MIPVILSPEEVRAALTGKLTEIRRPVEPMPGEQSQWLTRDLINQVPHGEIIEGGWQMHHPKAGTFSDGAWVAHNSPLGWVRCPLGGHGAQLFGQESWAAHWMYDDVPGTECRSGHPGDNYWYEADGEGAPGSCGPRARGYRGRWRDPAEMPPWASRIALRNRGVRVEKVDGVWQWIVALERAE